MIRMSHPVRTTGALAGVVVVALFGVFVGNGAASSPSAPSPRLGGAHVVEPATATTSRSVQVGGVTWTVIRRDSPDGACVGVVADVDGVEEGQVGGGCGEADEPTLRWGLGGLEVNGQWFNVAYGEVPITVSSVRVTLGDGSVLSDTNLGESAGSWVVVTSADPFDKAKEISGIEALSASGAILAEKTPPSVVDLRNAAKDQKTSPQ
jgi:hypothetical protein